MSATRPFAISTGASSGIGFELAKRCAKEGYDLLIAADEPEIEKAAASLREDGTEVEALQADLATTEGVDKLYAAVKGRQVDALLVNGGRSRTCVPGPGFWKGAAGHRYQYHRHGLPDPQGRKRYASTKCRQDPDHGIDRWLHPRQLSGRLQRDQGLSQLAFLCAAGGTQDTKVTVTCLMPGATETEFFRRAEMMDTAVGTTEKDDAAEVAKNGFNAMMKGEGDVVSGFKNKIQSAAANVTPAGVLASQHRKMAEPGTAKK